MSGLTQIRIYKQGLNRLQQFSKIVNNSTKAAIAYISTSTAFHLIVDISLTSLILVGMIIGVARSTELGQFGVIILYLFFISQAVSWSLRQALLVESLMVSAQRILQFKYFEK